jgi:hypothetical protein
MQAASAGREDVPPPPQFGQVLSVLSRNGRGGLRDRMAAVTAGEHYAEQGQEPAGAPAALDIRDTRWGFLVTEVPHPGRADQLPELGLKFVAAAFLVAALAKWLLPGSILSGDVVVMKLILTFALLGAAAAVFGFADRGFGAELQVDAVLREIRVCSRNAQGVAHVTDCIAMLDIEECFVRPAEREGFTEICLRVAGQAEPVAIAAGRLTDIAPILQRLTRDLRTPRERVELRMAS